ncbi:MAG: hypothetical protein HY673_24415 [Chloroflexi bacterium]|nr:hypothetical protein [Chloroflexota bacterium]
MQIVSSRPALESNLPLTIETPATNAVVKDETILIKGKTSPAAFVTAGRNKIDPDENGNFTARVVLEQGINIIEVLASDLSGNTKGQIFTLIYHPY